jgi:hypothetical protein
VNLRNYIVEEDVLYIYKIFISDENSGKVPDGLSLNKEGNKKIILAKDGKDQEILCKDQVSENYFSKPENLSANNCNMNPDVSINGSIVCSSNLVKLGSNDFVSFEPEPEDLDVSGIWQ